MLQAGETIRNLYVDGRLIDYPTREIVFWGNVDEAKDSSSDYVISGGKRLDNLTIQITADSRSTAEVSILDTLRIDGVEGYFEVMDKYDAPDGFRYTSMIIAQRKE